MLTQRECDILKSELHGTMVEAMQVTFLPSDDDIALCEMPITDTVRQYLGVLHGGAYLALAETHVSMSATHGKVFGKARLVYAGYSTHVWNVEIVGEDGTVLSVERVTNRILWSKKETHNLTTN